MFFTKRMVATTMLGLLATAASAQTQTLEGVKKPYYSMFSPMYAGNEVKGYLSFSRADKADRKNDNYHLSFYDHDLGKVSDIVLQKPAGRFGFLDNSFNGTAFAFYFFNTKDKTLEIETYDTSLKKIASKVIEEVSKADNMAIYNQQRAQDEGGALAVGMNLFPVPGFGFVRNSYTGNMKGYALVMYDNNLKAKWRVASEEKSKFYEDIKITEANDKYVLANIRRRDGMMSKKINSYMVAIDAATGKRVLDQPVEMSANEQLALSSFTFDAAQREFVAVGEYYKPTDKPFVNRSQGFFIKRFNEAGKPVSVKNYGWQQEVKALMPAEAKESVEQNFVNFTHSIVKGANGKLYIVAEQFKIVADGLGIAAVALGGHASVTKGRVGNMLIFELDAQSKLTGVKFYPKDPSNAFLPEGAGLLGTGLLGHMMKSWGDFDYQFMQKNDANTQFNAVYINYDKEKGEDTKRIIGNIAFGDNGKYALDKVDMTSGATSSFIYPAKPGYVMVADFYKKKKQVDLKLVKLNI